MSERKGKGIESVEARLREQAAEIARLERLLKGAKKRRGTLIAKLRRGGMSLRQVAPIAGISNPAISQEETARSIIEDNERKASLR